MRADSLVLFLLASATEAARPVYATQQTKSYGADA